MTDDVRKILTALVTLGTNISCQNGRYELDKAGYAELRRLVKDAMVEVDKAKNADDPKHWSFDFTKALNDYKASPPRDEMGALWRGYRWADVRSVWMRTEWGAGRSTPILYLGVLIFHNGAQWINADEGNAVTYQIALRELGLRYPHESDYKAQSK
jgi:hypothetical protein